MVFTLLDHPDRKLTLTEKSSKTISDIRDKARGPRFAQTTTYTMHYEYMSDFGLVVKNGLHQLSALGVATLNNLG
jgi:hypothetical protein